MKTIVRILLEALSYLSISSRVFLSVLRFYQNYPILSLSRLDEQNRDKFDRKSASHRQVSELPKQPFLVLSNFFSAILFWKTSTVNLDYRAYRSNFSWIEILSDLKTDQNYFWFDPNKIWRDRVLGRWRRIRHL